MPYTHLFSNMVELVRAGAIHGGYAFLFLMSTIEAVPFVGAFVPGHTAVIVSGFLAKVGVFNLYLVMAIAAAGAILGDAIGFHMGRTYGMSLIDRLRPYFFVGDEQVAKVRALVGRHTGKALIFGRFHPITRPLMPFVVGAGESDAARFWFFNVVGGITWAVASVMLGYVFGLGYHAAAGYVGKLVLISFIAAILLVWGYHVVNRNFHVFRRYELLALILNLIALWALARTIQDGFAADSVLANFDIAVNLFVAAKVTPFLVAAAAYLGTVAEASVIVAVSVVIGVALVYHRKLRSAAVIVLASLSTFIAFGALKEFFLRARPDNAVIFLSDPSFPSGHASMAAALMVAVAYVFAPRISHRARREWFIVLCVAVMLLVGVSRIALNVHWASDVIAGWALGVWCATASILFVRYASIFAVRRFGAGK